MNVLSHDRPLIFNGPGAEAPVRPDIEVAQMPGRTRKQDITVMWRPLSHQDGRAKILEIHTNKVVFAGQLNNFIILMKNMSDKYLQLALAVVSCLLWPLLRVSFAFFSHFRFLSRPMIHLN